MLARMGLPQTPVTLTPEQVGDIAKRLSETRHDINNHLALIVAAVELMRRKPESAERMLTTLGEQPQKIMDQMQKFSKDFEAALQYTRD
jgi:hypothetical protein